MLKKHASSLSDRLFQKKVFEALVLIFHRVPVHFFHCIHTFVNAAVSSGMTHSRCHGSPWSVFPSAALSLFNYSVQFLNDSSSVFLFVLVVINKFVQWTPQLK